MQIVETANEGLKRAYTLKIPAKEIEARIDAEVKKVAPQVKMPGFRPGKVPANLIRKMHGAALHSDALNAVAARIGRHADAREAAAPGAAAQGRSREGYEEGKDAELKVEVEVLPEIVAPSVDGLTLERLTVAVTDEALDEALQRLASNQKATPTRPRRRRPRPATS
jgi:trigger factor